jgi:hypothetical protein
MTPTEMRTQLSLGPLACTDLLRLAQLLAVLQVNWLQVFTSANTALLGHAGGQERKPHVALSEKDAARRGSVEDGMRMIPACCARASQRGTRRTYVHFLLIFQEVWAISKTRNQLNISLPNLQRHQCMHETKRGKGKIPPD